MSLEDKRKILAEDILTEKWSKVVDSATFLQYAIGGCSFCDDAKMSCMNDGVELITDKGGVRTYNYCGYCKGEMSVCNGTRNGSFNHALELARQGKDAELMAFVNDELNKYAREWVK